MLLYNKKDGTIFNLDNFTMIFMFKNKVQAYNDFDVKYIICECESEDEAEKVLAKIYTHMTYGSGNMILDLEEFRKEETETAKTRKALRNTKSCGGCIYQDTDGCYQWGNDGTRCKHYITEEEAIKDVNEEK